ncbi:MAG: hypothetical protein JSU85_05750 [Candidatus Zixiibacteriota bacterium]|nr:MAG: hypothetical protein JSU85_05750 [candidate division Zixibacteria bacterium]
MIGEFNSSITRVRPAFQMLLRKDQTGVSWVPRILKLADKNTQYASQLAEDPGRIYPPLLRKRNYSDPILKERGIHEIRLEECFEKYLPPPKRFLQWLIQNPSKMSWPKMDLLIHNQEILIYREKLFGQHGEVIQNETIARALRELNEYGVKESKGKWWAFEDFTEVDCYLETDNLILFIEGTRKEPLANSTAWYRGRNQLVRNLEVAQEISGDKDFAAVVISESRIDPVTPEVIEKGLPHFSPDERQELAGHYLGNILWKDICRATNILYDDLPLTTSDAVAKMK